jgi:DNA polymerase I-like protein with 3'-5' exonuclease and polymerase domains
MKLFCLDFETAGKDVGFALMPWRYRSGEMWPTILATGEASTKTTSLIEHPTKENVENFIEAAGHAPITGWNLAYDISVILAMGVDRRLVFKASWQDTQLLYKRVDKHYKQLMREEFRKYKGNSYSLKVAVAEHFPQHAGYEADINYHVEKNADVDPQLLEYARKDVIFTLALHQILLTKLPSDEFEMYRRECLILPSIAEANQRGIEVDYDAAQRLADNCQDQMAFIQANTGLTAEQLSSPAQLGKVLFHDFGLSPVKRSEKTGKPSVDKHTLTVLSDDERVKPIKEWRELRTKLTKFASGVVESADFNGDGMTYPSAIPVGTYTGRMTYGSKVKTHGPAGRA